MIYYNYVIYVYKLSFYVNQNGWFFEKGKHPSEVNKDSDNVTLIR